MSKTKKIVLASAAFVIIALLVVAGLTGNGNLAGTAWSLFPPVVAIALALITKEVYSSLFIGVVTGALMASNFSFTGTMDALVGDGLITAVADNAGIFIFLVELGAMVALLNRAGAAQAFGRWAQTHIKTKLGALLATFVLGVLIFIDDYFNCLTVGSVMAPITDSKKISRAKLAYLIDATAAPVCMIAPISSWAAAVSSNVTPEIAGDLSGLALFVRAIPFNFYSLLTLVFVAISVILAILNEKFGIAAIAYMTGLSWGTLAGCFMGPFVLGMLWRRVTKSAAWASICSSLVLTASLVVLLGYAKDGFECSFSTALKNGVGCSPLIGVICMIFSLVITAVVSLLTKAPSDEIITAAFDKEVDGLIK